MNKLKNKNEKAITLIALVITIIVLLILAGVAINMAINSDGLFGKAKEAAESWNTAVAEEERITQNILEQYNEIMGGNSGGSDDGDDDDDNDDPPALPEGWDSAKVGSTVTQTSTVAGKEATRTVPIPKGFTVSQIGGDTPENTISGGLVIYQTGDADVTTEGFWTNTDTDGNLICQTTYNQFVWIPVDDINQMIMCKSNNSTGTVSETDTTDVCNIALQTDGTLKCETHNSSDLCGRLYGADSTVPTTPCSTSMNFADRTQTWDNSHYREPDLLKCYSYEDYYSMWLNAAGVASEDELARQLTTDFTAMAVSVKIYGGFYVSRYEAGENGISKKNVYVNPEADTWYGLYGLVRKEITAGTSTIKSHMIYGSQYDQIINFIGTEAQKAHSQKVEFDMLSGTYPEDKFNNIYDLEGNFCEWTAEINGSVYTTYRGSALEYGGYGASVRCTTEPYNAYIMTSTRSSLYL